MDELTIGNVGIAKSVIEDIVRLALERVEGVAAVGAGVFATNLISLLSNKDADKTGVDVRVQDDKLVIAVYLNVFYGYSFKPLADQVRSVIADALKTQVGVDVHAVDVFVDSLVLPKS